MVTVITTADIIPGNLFAVLQWAAKAAATFRENNEDVQVVRNYAGAGLQIHFLSTYDSMETYVAARKRTEAAPYWQEMLSEAAGMVGAFRTSIYETIF